GIRGPDHEQGQRPALVRVSEGGVVDTRVGGRHALGERDRLGVPGGLAVVRGLGAREERRLRVAVRSIHARGGGEHRHEPERDPPRAPAAPDRPHPFAGRHRHPSTSESPRSMLRTRRRSAMMSRKAAPAITGIDTNPNTLRYRPVQLAPAEHTPTSSVGRHWIVTWYAAISTPTTGRGMAYRQAPASPRTAATPNTRTSGYMTMRWYQHSEHGTNPTTSER